MALNPQQQSIIINEIKKSLGKKKVDMLSQYEMAKGAWRVRKVIKREIKYVILMLLGILSAGFGLKGFLIPNGLIDRQGLIVVIDGFLVIAHCLIRHRHIVDDVGFHLSIINRPHDRDGPIEKIQRHLRFGQTGVGHAHIEQCYSFTAAIAGDAFQCQRLFVKFQGFSQLAEIRI